MNVLYVIPSFYPAVRFGGPIITSLGLCHGIVRTGRVKLHVLTTDVAGRALRQKVDLRDTARIKLPYDVKYCHRIAGYSISLELLQLLIEKIQWAHIVHLHAVYSFPTIPTLFVARMLRKPVVWSPHGAFQEWQAYSKHLLKRCWRFICHTAWNHEHCCLHVSSQMEKEGSQKLFKNSCCEVIPNGVDLPEIISASRPSRNKAMKLMFMGRIHPKKGLENLLRAMAALNGLNCTLDICGGGEAHYLDSIKRLCRGLGLRRRVYFRGQVDGFEKHEAYTQADVCIVPSHMESFGNVVAEALAHGVPVIASTGTPWTAIEQKGCGIWTPNDPISLAKAIIKMSTMDRCAMGERGRYWMQCDFSWEKISRRMLSLYERLIRGENR